MTEAEHESRTKLLDAAVSVIRAKGYSAARVDDICAAAGLTKGSFFHHFESKEDLAIAAAQAWNDSAVRLFAEAPYMAETDPLARLLGYLRFRRQLVAGDLREWTCYAGTTIQEVHETHPAIREACAQSITAHLAHLTTLAEQVLAERPVPRLRAQSLATHIQVVLQGAFVMAKAAQDAQVAVDSIDHLTRYVEMLFARSTRKKHPR